MISHQKILRTGRNRLRAELRLGKDLEVSLLLSSPPPAALPHFDPDPFTLNFTQPRPNLRPFSQSKWKRENEKKKYIGQREGAKKGRDGAGMESMPNNRTQQSQHPEGLSSWPRNTTNPLRAFHPHGREDTLIITSTFLCPLTKATEPQTP